VIEIRSANEAKEIRFLRQADSNMRYCFERDLETLSKNVEKMIDALCFGDNFICLCHVVLSKTAGSIATAAMAYRLKEKGWKFNASDFYNARDLSYTVDGNDCVYELKLEFYDKDGR
jgi:hypothetical protein